MRARSIVMLSRLAAAAAVCFVMVAALAPAAQARDLILAQDTEAPAEDQADPEEQGETGQETSEAGDEEGQAEPEAETGATEEETEGAADETGPPWTYQMAWLSVALLLLLFLAMGGMYFRFVVSRQRRQA